MITALFCFEEKLCSKILINFRTGNLFFQVFKMCSFFKRIWNDETNWSVGWWLISVLMCGEKKTTRNISFVSIHNSLYTQCIGAPIKKHLFFPNSFFPTFFKKPQILLFFFPTESKEKLRTTNKRQQNSSSWAASQHLGHSHSFHLWSGT